MRTFVTGDTHGGELYGFKKFNSRQFQNGKELTKEDVVIIVGDFGLIWDNDPANKNEQYWLNWFNEKPWTTVFIDGNHENHFRLDNLPTEKKWGAPVGKVNDSVYHLKRGYIYTINDMTFFAFGGGQSIDKASRIPDVSWWAREIPSYMEMKRGLDNLEKINWEVDFIIAHECPTSIITKIISHHVEPYNFTNYLEEVVTKTDFVQYFFGHHHQNRRIGEKYMCLYDKIVEINPI